MGWVRECEVGEYGHEADDMEGAIGTVRRLRTSGRGVLTSKGQPRPPNTEVVWVKGQTLVLAKMGQLQIQAYRGHLLQGEFLLEIGWKGSWYRTTKAVVEERTTPQGPAVAVLVLRKGRT
jgi:hypothetical protein